MIGPEAPSSREADAAGRRLRCRARSTATCTTTAPSPTATARWNRRWPAPRASSISSRSPATPTGPTCRSTIRASPTSSTSTSRASPGSSGCGPAISTRSARAARRSLTVFPGYEIHSCEYGDYTILFRDLDPTEIVKADTRRRTARALAAALRRPGDGLPAPPRLPAGHARRELERLRSRAVAGRRDRLDARAVGGLDGRAAVPAFDGSGRRTLDRGPRARTRPRLRLSRQHRPPQRLSRLLRPRPHGDLRRRKRPRRRSGTRCGRGGPTRSPATAPTCSSLDGVPQGGIVAPGAAPWLDSRPSAAASSTAIDLIRNGRIVHRVTPELTPAPDRRRRRPPSRRCWSSNSAGARAARATTGPASCRCRRRRDPRRRAAPARPRDRRAAARATDAEDDDDRIDATTTSSASAIRARPIPTTHRRDAGLRRARARSTPDAVHPPIRSTATTRHDPRVPAARGRATGNDRRDGRPGLAPAPAAPARRMAVAGPDPRWNLLPKATGSMRGCARPTGNGPGPARSSADDDRGGARDRANDNRTEPDQQRRKGENA